MTGAVVDQYLAFATLEQLRVGVTPKQVTPILRADLEHLMRDMHTGLLCAAQPVDRLAYARDMALFAVAFRTGSRGSDLAKLLGTQVFRLPSNQGLLLNFHFTKTLRDGASHASLLAPDNDMPETCAVAAMIRYAQAADSCGWDISTDYLFPEMTASGDRTPKRLARPLFAKAMAARRNTWNTQAWGCGTLPSVRLGWVAPSHRLSQKRTLQRLWRRLLTGSQKKMHAGMWEA